MKENMVMVKSASDCTIVIDLPNLQFRREWKRRDAVYPIDRDLLEQAFYEPAVEYLIRNGLLIVEDKQFLFDVGMINALEEESPVKELTEKEIKKLLKYTPVKELTDELKKLSPVQLEELGNYAIEHYEDVANDRLTILNKATGKDMLKAIQNQIASKEE